MCGLEIYSGTVGTHLNKLKRLLNMVVRFVFNVQRRDHIPLYVKQF